jgi:hypothetical protein
MPSSKVCSGYALVARESYLQIEAHSTLPNPIRSEALDLNGIVSASVSGGVLDLDPMPAMHVLVPVAKLTSGNEFQDREFRKLIGSTRNPHIIGELTRIERGPAPDRYLVRGAITVNGVRREYDGEVRIRVEGSRIVIDGSQKMDIRSFEITPPRILTIQIYPDFEVTMHVVAERAD